MIPFPAATIAELMAQLPPPIARIVTAARKQIAAVVPQAVERLRPGWGFIGYNAPAYFAFIVPEPARVRLGFEWGVLLDDRTGLLTGAGSQVRYAVLPTAAAVRSPALADLLREAAALPPRSAPRRRHP